MEVFPVQLTAGGFLGTLPSLISHMNSPPPLLNQMCLHYAWETDTCKQHPPSFLLQCQACSSLCSLLVNKKKKFTKGHKEKKYIKLNHGYFEISRQELRG